MIPKSLGKNLTGDVQLAIVIAAIASKHALAHHSDELRGTVRSKLRIVDDFKIIIVTFME